MVSSFQPHKLTTPRIVIADDNEIARISLRSMLEINPNVAVVGEAACGEEAITLCQQLQPDIVFLDLRMPGIDGFAATEAIVRECPSTRVIIITMHDHNSYLLEAFRVGAMGYLLKDSSYDELMLALEWVNNGYRYVATGIRRPPHDDVNQPPLAPFSY